jgi:hypothetical protein
MKFKIEVELDWISEEGDIDKEIQTAIVSKVVSSVSEDIKKTVQKEASAIITPKVTELVEKTYEELISGEVTLTDKWGDKKKTYSSIKELIKASWDSYLDEMVDAQGRTTRGYGETKKRVDTLIYDQLEKFSKEWTKKVLVEITDNIKATLSNDLKAALGERILDVIDLKQLIAKSKG